jgi:hypothetical protein
MPARVAIEARPAVDAVAPTPAERVETGSVITFADDKFLRVTELMADIVGKAG